MIKIKTKDIFPDMDLQWFSDVNLVDPPTEEEDKPSPKPNSGFSGLEKLDVEILDEGLAEMEDKKEEEEGPTKEEILANLEAKEKELEALRGNTNLAASFDRLTDTLTKPQQQQQGQKPQMTPEQLAEMRKKIDKGLYDKGYTATTDEYIGQTVIPYINKMLGVTLHDRKELAKLQYAEYFKKYEGEIDAEVQKIPEQERLADPEVYKKAAAKVRANHVDDIVAEQVALKVEEKLAEMGITPEGKAKPKPVGYSQVKTNSQPKAKKPRMYLTPKEKAIADRKGVSEDMALRLKYDYWD